MPIEGELIPFCIATGFMTHAEGPAAEGPGADRRGARGRGGAPAQPWATAPPWGPGGGGGGG